jgi:hypothetical protein
MAGLLVVHRRVPRNPFDEREERRRTVGDDLGEQSDLLQGELSSTQVPVSNFSTFAAATDMAGAAHNRPP